MKFRYSLLAAMAVAVAVLAMALLAPAQRAQGGAETPTIMAAAVLPPGMADLFDEEKRHAQEQEPSPQF